MRRVVFAASAAMLIVATLLTSTAVVSAAGTRKVALGVSQYDGSRDPAAVRAFANQAGHYPASWTIWSTWGDEQTRDFPSQMVDDLQHMGVTPMIWWEPMRVRESCDFARHKSIAAGKYDAYIKRWARDAKAAGGRIIVRWAHEINGAYFPWGTAQRQCGNTPKLYKKAWIHIYKTFKAERATNVKFLWTVAKSSCHHPCNPYKQFYPGDKFVDYAGFSSFNWGAMKGTWTSMISGVSGIMNQFKAFTHKPIIVAETASHSCCGSKPDWIREGYPAVYSRFPQIKGVSYLNVDLSNVGHPNWSLSAPEEAMAAYRSVADQSRFQGGY